MHFLEDTVSLAVPARAFLGTHGGITNIPSLCGIATAEFETVWENLAKTAALMRVADELDQPILPYATGKILYAFLLHLEYRVRAGLNQDNAINWFTLARLADWNEHVRVWHAYKDVKSNSITEVPKLSNPKNWLAFKELLKTQLQEECNSILGIPMAYLICDEVPVENEHVQADYPYLDERLIWCIEQTGAMCQEDNSALYSLLKSN